MESNLEVLFAPAEFAALRGRDLSDIVCVVFDVLRATSSMLTALANGASRITPVCEISEALEYHKTHPNALLAGEREGLRILRSQTGSVDFDLGNSPREFTADRVSGCEIVITTTNGTRALKACIGARRILASGFLNLCATAEAIRVENAPRLLIICAGTFEETAYEDTLAAGALCDLVWTQFADRRIADSAQIARQIYRVAGDDFSRAMQYSRNARRLLANPALRDDVAFCLQRDSLNFTAQMHDGAVVKL
ncbi:MAG TPA: 2-phosphosulfolactate phosphatase [Verrucomicrobiae bacterium]|jgi:2-phosphosulfolactate phosphatase